MVILLEGEQSIEGQNAAQLGQVRRNVSLPSWLNVEAEKAGVNVSAVLQAALKKELHIVE